MIFGSLADRICALSLIVVSRVIPPERIVIVIVALYCPAGTCAMETGILNEPLVGIPTGKAGVVILNAVVLSIVIFKIESGAQALLLTVTKVSSFEQSDESRRFRSFERITLNPDF